MGFLQSAGMVTISDVMVCDGADPAVFYYIFSRADIPYGDACPETPRSRIMEWRPSVPVAVRHAKARREMNRLRKKGRNIQPVEIEGRTIARSFWGKRWCNLESFSDYANRPGSRRGDSIGYLITYKAQKWFLSVRHSRESGNPGGLESKWIPAFAGMTGFREPVPTFP